MNDTVPSRCAQCDSELDVANNCWFLRDRRRSRMVICCSEGCARSYEESHGLPTQR